MRLKQLADRTRGNYGLPSVETHMATVVFGQLAMVSSEFHPAWAPAVWAAATALVLVVAFSRLVAGSRFVYQVVVSMGTGAAGIPAAMRITRTLGPWRLEWHDVSFNKFHTIVMMTVGSCFAAYIAAAAEDTSSWFFSIPNDEFVRVLRGVYEQKEGVAPRRRVNGETYAPPDSLSLMTARVRERAAAGPAPVV